MIEYLKICRIDHWLKNIFIVFGHAVALVLVFELDLGSVDSDNAAMAAARAGFITKTYLHLTGAIAALAALEFVLLQTTLAEPLVELMVGSTVWVAVLAAVFVVSRLAHAIGFSMSSGVTPGRLVGTLGSMICMVVASGYLVYLVVDKL